MIQAPIWQGEERCGNTGRPEKSPDGHRGVGAEGGGNGPNGTRTGDGNGVFLANELKEIEVLILGPFTSQIEKQVSCGGRPFPEAGGALLFRLWNTVE